MSIAKSLVADLESAIAAKNSSHNVALAFESRHLAGFADSAPPPPPPRKTAAMGSRELVGFGDAAPPPPPPPRK